MMHYFLACLSFELEQGAAAPSPVFAEHWYLLQATSAGQALQLAQQTGSLLAAQARPLRPLRWLGVTELQLLEAGSNSIEIHSHCTAPPDAQHYRHTILQGIGRTARFARQGLSS